MHCNNCRARLAKNAKFCSRCGFQVITNPTQPQTPPSQPPQAPPKTQPKYKGFLTRKLSARQSLTIGILLFIIFGAILSLFSILSPIYYESKANKLMKEGNLGKAVEYLEMADKDAIEIPYGIKSIPKECFKDYYHLKEITIPDSVTTIKASAFEGCEKLEKIIMSSNATNINERAFWGCKNLQTISSLDSVEHIGNSAFAGCSRLKSISFSDNLKSIGEHAFDSCSFDTLMIPDSVTAIGFNSFCNAKINKLILGEKFDINNLKGFFYCRTLQQIEVSPKNNSFTVVDNVLFNERKTDILLFPKGVKEETYCIPNTTEEISQYAFTNSQINTLILNDGIKKIDQNAFNSRYIKKINIPLSVTHIGYNAFKYCDNLESITYAGTKSDWQKIVFSYDYKIDKEIICADGKILP